MSGNNLSVVVILLTLLLGASAGVRENQREDANAAQRRVEETRWALPVADLNAALPLDPKERAKREAKSKKYDRGFPMVAPGVHSAEVYDWPSHFPALPVSQSDGVIVGQVFDAKAYFSVDKTTIYSEFWVTVESILKNSDKNPIDGGSQLALERMGGRVQYPSGEVSSFLVAGFGVPRVGGRYVFFLKRNPQDEGYTIVTGYELRLGHVYPLDATTSSETDFTVYNNFDETQFLKNLTSISRR